MAEKYAKLIESKRFSRAYADTECLDIYESNCDNVDEFIEAAKIETPMKGKTTGWWQAYIDRITKTEKGYNVTIIIPFTD